VTTNPERFTIRTARLELVAARLELFEAELSGHELLGLTLGAIVPPSWPPGEYDRNAAAYFRDRLFEAGEAVAPWYAWYAICLARPDRAATLIGCGGFFGPPTPDGTVEIGYSIVPECRRLGYATEMVRALMAHAFATPEVRRILAEADVENLASITVLNRCGFRRMGSGREPHFDRYQRDRPADAAAYGNLT
jgi:ribosomal-protein-alanine N-acetyltransferase